MTLSPAPRRCWGPGPRNKAVRSSVVKAFSSHPDSTAPAAYAELAAAARHRFRGVELKPVSPIVLRQLEPILAAETTTRARWVFT